MVGHMQKQRVLGCIKRFPSLRSVVATPLQPLHFLTLFPDVLDIPPDALHGHRDLPLKRSAVHLNLPNLPDEEHSADRTSLWDPGGPLPRW